MQANFYASGSRVWEAFDADAFTRARPRVSLPAGVAFWDDSRRCVPLLRPFCASGRLTK